ncbi:MAG TPA: ATP synthase F1 subunit delta [Pyrinomonadaceae bacterium]|nr:ATP synthase F1 subunit delta [Pyrinomonadaceae bacterium]
MSVETIARRYATALADVVTKSGEIEPVRNELRVWEQIMTANVDLQNAVRNPAIPLSSKEKVLNALIEKARPSRTTANFLRVLLRNGRLTELTEINAKLETVLEERSGSVVAEVTSARDLSGAQQNELKSNLEKLTGKQVKLNFAIDPAIIGGVVTRVGSTVYDGSVKSQLENLKEEMIGS